MGENYKEKVNIVKDLMVDAIIELSKETPKGNKKALKLLNKYLAMKEVLTAGEIAVAHFFKGEAYLKQNYLQDAKGEIEIAIKTDPTLNHQEVFVVTAWQSLADISERGGKYSDSINYHQKAIDNLLIMVDPEQAKRFIAITYLEFAQLFMRNQAIENSYINCMKYVELSIESDPEFPDCHFFLGAIYADKGNPPKAVYHLEQYIKLVSHDDPQHRSSIENAEKILKNLRNV
jgi:tetratricopeptide (TPR) repeat protein